MNKNYNLKLDLQFRCNNSTMKFNQFDNNTSDFFMKISNGGKSFDIEKAIVVLAVIKPNSKVSSQFIEVENGLVYADLKPNMKDEIGTYTAQAMLILEDERVVTDTINYEVNESKIISALIEDVENQEEYTLLTDMLSRLSTIEISEEQRMINEAERILAEENRKIEEAKRVEAELVRQHEEADRTKYDATRESNENIRKQNESIRLANETNRIDEESKRVEEENKRKLAEDERNANYNFMTEDEERRRSEANVHKEAEVLRVQAETNRVNEEAKRRTTEQARILAENTRVNSENTRKSNEETRQSNESKRVEAETQRQSRYNSFILEAEANANNFENYTNTAKVKEEERKANELDRKTQEDRRISNEVERISNENTRKANEEAREENETSRQNIFKNKVSEVDEKISELNTTKDNFVSSINTKVDTKISELDTAKSDMTNTVTNKIDEVENRFNALTSKQQQDAEVVDARDGETSLKARLDRDIEKAKQVYVNVEGSRISTDSNVGYLKDVEILGNTIQDASNLADIRSVGDKVEGRELYEIPVLSVGKNLFKRLAHNYYGGITIEKDDGNEVLYKTTSWNTGVKLLINSRCLKLNTQYTLSWENVASGSGLEGIYFSDNNFSSSKLITMNRTFSISSYKNDFITIFMKNGSITSTSGFRNIQLEEGTVATPYEPYQEDKLTILSPTQLEKVGDVADRIIEKDGVWGVEKNVETFNFSDSYSWSIANELENTIRFSTHIDNLKGANLKIIEQNEKAILISNKFITKSVSEILVSDFECVGVTSHLSFRVNKSSLSSLDSNGFNSFLINNNVLIKYQTTQPQFIPLPHDQQVKLRTFASKTNISFGCEIEGTIKAQVPKSLGATVNTHTEQISNLNKELDRVKKLEESTVSTVETESDFTTVEATSNGYFEDVKLEGKTLVVNADNEIVEAGTEGATLKSVGDGADEIVVESVKGDGNLADFQPFTTTATNTKVKGRDCYIPEGTTQLKYSIKLDDGTELPYDIGNFEISFRDKADNTIVSKSLTSTNTLTFTQGQLDACKKIGFYYNSKFGIKTISKFYLYAGDVKYELYQSDKKRLLYYNEETQTWEKPVLRQWDSIEKHADGKYYYHQRSGEVVLNGSENVSLGYNNNLLNVLSFDVPISDIIPTQTYDPSCLVCDRFNVVKGDILYNTDVECVSIWNSPKVRINILKSKLSTQDVQGFKQWLQANNVTVVYQLAQEKVYECTNIDLITYANKTNYIVECGAIVPRTTLKVHNNISNVVSLLQKKVSLLESNITSYMITQNRLMLASRYNADTVSFKVDVASYNNSFEYDNDLYELILNNILVGKDNYNREYIENLIIFYWMDFVISDEMHSTLFEIIEEQHNPKVIEEETPLI